LFERVAWIWEDYISGVLSAAAFADICRENIRQSIEGRLVALHELRVVACHKFFVLSTSLGGAGSECDWSAIHVHLTVADFVKPALC
jgi:hypothetical protein